MLWRPGKIWWTFDCQSVEWSWFLQLFAGSSQLSRQAFKSDLSWLTDTLSVNLSILDFWNIEFETFYKNRVGRTWFLVYFELDFYCAACKIKFVQLDFSKIKYRWIGRETLSEKQPTNLLSKKLNSVSTFDMRDNKVCWNPRSWMTQTSILKKGRNIRLEDQELVLHSRDAVRLSNPGGQAVMWWV